MIVKNLMNDEVIHIFSGNTVFEASQEMAKHKRGLLVVMDNDDDRNVVGVISDKDIVREIVSKKRNPQEVTIREVMSPKVIFISPMATLSEAMVLMRENKIKRLIVMEGKKLSGIISSNDILDGMITYKKKLLDLALDF